MITKNTQPFKMKINEQYYTEFNHIQQVTNLKTAWHTQKA
jgi:hypothetical protein